MSTHYEDLWDILPKDFPSENYCSSRCYRDWERTVHLHVITKLGYKGVRFSTLEGDSFGPLVRSMNCFDENDKHRTFTYG